MSGIEGIAAISAATEATSIMQSAELMGRRVHTTSSMSFGELLTSEIEKVEAKIRAANEIVYDFSVDETVPIHQVTIALEEARLAVEMALQVRTRLLEGYREIMNMQL